MSPPLSPAAVARVLEATHLVAALRDSLQTLGRQVGGDVAAAAGQLEEAERRLRRAVAGATDLSSNS